MNYKDISLGILRSIGILIGILIGLYFLWLIKSVIAYVFIAFAVSLMGRPIMNVLNKKLKFSNNLSSILTLVIILFLFSSIFALTIPLFLEQSKNLSLLDLNSLQMNVKSQILEIDKSLEAKGIDLISNQDLNQGSSSFNTGNFTSFFENIFTYLTDTFIGIFSIIFITFFFLKDGNLFNRMIIGAVPDKDEGKITDVLDDTKDLLSKYFLGLLLQVFIMFSLYLIILLSFGIENAFIIAFLCALLNLVPYLGPVIGAFVFSLLSMSSMFAEGLDMQTQILPRLLYIIILYFAAQLVDNFINQPIIYSKSVKSHPLEIFLVMLISGLLFGILGVVFAVPGYTVLRLILKKFFSNFKVVQSITKNI